MTNRTRTERLEGSRIFCGCRSCRIQCGSHRARRTFAVRALCLALSLGQSLQSHTLNYMNAGVCGKWHDPRPIPLFFLQVKQRTSRESHLALNVNAARPGHIAHCPNPRCEHRLRPSNPIQATWSTTDSHSSRAVNQTGRSHHAFFVSSPPAAIFSSALPTSSPSTYRPFL